MESVIVPDNIGFSPSLKAVYHQNQRRKHVILGEKNIIRFLFDSAKPHLMVLRDLNQLTNPWEKGLGL